MAAFPSGTVTFLFTDIEGSTKLLHELGDEYGTVVADHRRILRDAFGAADGREVDTQGDAFFYAGLDVVRAARICSAGHGGQILLSETTRALAGGDLPPGVSIRDLGEQRLKDVSSERVYQLDLADDPRSFPALKTERSAGDDFGDRLGARIESMVERQLESAFAGDRASTKPLAGLTAFGLVTLVVFVVVVVGLVLLVKVVFF